MTAEAAGRTGRGSERPGRDGVRLAVLSKRLDGITARMANTLLRTGRSGVLNTARDFSCCIVTAGHELLSAADCFPIHVLRGADLMSRALAEFHPVMRRGDAYLHNSPYHGNTHAADHTIMVPVVDGDGRHHFTLLAKAHQADCGNSLPTTYMAAARDVYEEGALIFPAVKVQEDYEDIEDIIRMCEMRIRVPAQWRGDYLAMTGAARIGEREMLRLGEEVGWDTLHAHAAQWLDYSEELMIDAISALPSGRAVAGATHDPVPGTPPHGIAIQAAVEIDAQAARVTVDLTDNPDNLPCGLNLSQACSLTAAMIGVFNGLERHVPPNAGSFRRVDVRLREGCVVGVPRHPASCSVSTTNLGDRVICATQRAMAEIDPHIGLADAGAVLPPSSGVISGTDPRTGGQFCNQLLLSAGAGPGTPWVDGWVTFGTMSNAGMAWRDSIEIDELKHPIQIHERRLVEDAEGAGTFRGSPAARIEYGPIDCAITVVYVSDGTVNPAKGARGGLDGAPARQFKRTADGALHPLPVAAQITLEPGETVLSHTAGAGGYGPPTAREPVHVARDVAERWITRERANGVYGVALNDEGGVDEAATARRRAKMAQDGFSGTPDRTADAALR